MEVPIEPNLVENSTQTWENFKIANSLEYTNREQYNLLRTTLCPRSVTTPVGDIDFKVGNTKFTLDCAILASKSLRIRDMLLTYAESGYRLSEIINHIKALIGGDDPRLSNIVDILYGKELETIMTEDNFSRLFRDMYDMKMEIDLEIFKKFIEKNIQPKAKFSNQMFDLHNTLIRHCNHSCDYLLPIVSQHLSDHLLEIYNMKKFLSLSSEEFVQILSYKNDNSQEKGLIGYICAKWICQIFQTRIDHLKDLVNVAKFRYGLLPYCDWNPDLKCLSKNKDYDESQVEEVEQYFNELLFNHGDVSFASPPNLKTGLNCKVSGVQVVNFVDPIVQWKSFLTEGNFCDIVVNVQGTFFKLHLVKLLIASEYFRNLFTDRSADKPISESPTKYTLTINHINPGTFRDIIQYIYENEIEVTSQSHLIKLLNGSKFLKMNDLFEKCTSMMLKIVRKDVSSDIFEVFHYACENAKYSELYNVAAEKIVGLWQKHDETPGFKNISSRTLMEILALPSLTLQNPDEILDLCSRWIFHDVDNRYYRIVQIAKAINRNFMVDSDKFKVEIPSNGDDYTLKFVKEQLTKILSSSALVSLNADCIQNERKNPKFLLLNEDKILTVVDVNFNQIVQLARIDKDTFRYTATMVDDKLFILFNNGDQFHFQCYSLATRRMISLATDARMDICEDYVILCCNNEVYYCDTYDVLKYDTKLNRWISLMRVYKKSQLFVKYTSDGKRIYKLFLEDSINDCYEVSFYDFQKKKWISLPYISDIFDENTKPKNPFILEVNIINHELCVMCSTKTHRFSWITQSWNYISYSYQNFVEFTGHEENVAYISGTNQVHVYSPVFNKWTSERKLDNVRKIVPIHVIEK